MSAVPVQGVRPVQLAGEVLQWLRQETSHMTCTDRTPAAFVSSALLRASIDHFAAIYSLTQMGMHTSAHALLRVEWQSLINGLWLYFVCPPGQVHRVWGGIDAMPGLAHATNAVEAALFKRAVRLGKQPATERGRFNAFTRMKKQLVATMHDFTHTGPLQMRNLTEPKGVSPETIDSALVFAACIALYAAAGLAIIAERDDLELAAEDVYKRFHANITRIGNVELTPEMLQQALHKARAEGLM